MLAYSVRRLLLAALIVVIAVSLMFVMIHAVPRRPGQCHAGAARVAGVEGASD